MRDIGMGRQGFEDAFLQEIEELLSVISAESQDGSKAVAVHQALGSSAGNGINLVMTGNRLEPGHPTRRLIDASFLPRGPKTQPSIFYPPCYLPLVAKLMLRLPAIGPAMAFGTRVQQVLRYLYDQAHKQIAAQAASQVDDDDSVNDSFIGTYVRHMRSGSVSGKYFDTDHLVGNAISFFAAGAATIGDFLTWFTLIMALHPDIQSRMRAEVDEVLGDRAPSYRDREAMPYTCAFLLELLRFTTSVPSGLWHATGEDVELEGYFLPKGTQLIFSLYAVHFDPDIFPQPENFDPTGFLDQEGKFVREERVIAFGIGKRSCAGQPIAEMEMFLYACSFLQRFIISTPAGSRLTTKGVTDFIGRIPADSPVSLTFTPRSRT